MYRPVSDSQDYVKVPRLLFSKLGAQGADDARFRTALYIISNGGGDVASVAAALSLPQSKVRSALDYWEGAGLIERIPTADTAGVPEIETGMRKRLTTAEVARASENDTVLREIIFELQRIFGGVISQADINVFATLYHSDKIPADLIRLAAMHCAANDKKSARYIEKLLLVWRRDGIATTADADRYLQIIAAREANEALVAETMGLPAGCFSSAEKKKIAVWFEEYSYGTEMLNAAMLAAGDKQKDVRYIDGIFKQWFRKGYKTPMDLQHADENRNVRVQGSQTPVAPENDLLMNNTAYKPLKKRNDM